MLRLRALLINSRIISRAVVPVRVQAQRSHGHGYTKPFDNMPFKITSRETNLLPFQLTPAAAMHIKPTDVGIVDQQPVEEDDDVLGLPDDNLVLTDDDHLPNHLESSDEENDISLQELGRLQICRAKCRAEAARLRCGHAAL
ncbi:hypothetical protein ACJJTC_000769 [Scirpophaga incertulas]